MSFRNLKYCYFFVKLKLLFIRRLIKIQFTKINENKQKCWYRIHSEKRRKALNGIILVFCLIMRMRLFSECIRDYSFSFNKTSHTFSLLIYFKFQRIFYIFFNEYSTKVFIVKDVIKI